MGAGLNTGTAWSSPDSDRSDAPYILVTSEVESPDPLPLKESRAQVDIVGVMAHVKVTQVYENRGSKPLEAIYVFPGSTRAAVFGMQMQVGKRKIAAVIEKAERAKELYQAGKRAGKTSSLLEQKRPNVFQMSVANILPGDVVKVELDYTELIEATEGVYEFVYPAVVGPRYGGESTRNEDWHRNPYLGEGKSEPYRFGLDVRISTGIGIAALTSPSHTVSPVYKSKSEASLSFSGKGNGNRDVVLRYQLRGGAIQTGMLRYAGAKENFFLMMVQPPKRVAPASIPPREYVFIVDVSGSMNGFPLDVSKKLMAELLRRLRPSDRFNILFFAGGSYQLGENSLPATPGNVARALRVMGERTGGGGTNLLAALRKAMAMKASRDVSRTFVVVTDGYVPVETEAFGYVRQNLGTANFFTFGIGSSVNRHLLEGLARAGNAESFVVLKQSEAAGAAARFRKMIETPVLTNIKVSYDKFGAYDVEPAVLSDLFADRPILVYGKYRGSGEGAITVTGSHGGGRYRQTVRGIDARPTAENRSLRYLWARHRIRSLEDGAAFEGKQQQNREKITKLGLDYNLLTQYTSFVAVDPEQRTNQASEKVRQPLPLPKGVSQHALGRGQVIANLPASASAEGAYNADGYSFASGSIGGYFISARYARGLEYAWAGDSDVRSAAASAVTLGGGNWAITSQCLAWPVPADSTGCRPRRFCAWGSSIASKLASGPIYCGSATAMSCSRTCTSAPRCRSCSCASWPSVPCSTTALISTSRPWAIATCARCCSWMRSWPGSCCCAETSV